MSVDAVLLESSTMRSTVAGRVEVLDRVGALRLLPEDLHVTTEGVAEFFGVGAGVIKAVVFDHRVELTANGYRTLSGAQLGYFKQLSGIQSRARSLALFTRRTVLNVAMLLRDSETARQVRCLLLDVEQEARREALSRPVENRSAQPDGSLEGAVARVAERVVRDVVGTAVVPLLNALAVEVGRNSTKLDALADRVGRLERVVLDDDERTTARRRLRLFRAVEAGVDDGDPDGLPV